MKKVILVLVVLSLAGCLSKPKVETVAVEDSAVVKLDSAVVDSVAVDSIKVK